MGVVGTLDTSKMGVARILRFREVTPVPSLAVYGGHHCHHCGLLPLGRPAPGRGAGAAGAETAGEAANRRHLPAQQ